jgi:DNA adenine methylase
MESAKRVAAALNGAQLRCCDFADALAEAGEGDVVYADPPYTTKGENNGFVRYNEKLFAWADQERLAENAAAAALRASFVCVSNLWHKDVLALYTGWWALRVRRHSLIARSSDSRQGVTEALLFSRKPVTNAALTTEIVRL